MSDIVRQAQGVEPVPKSRRAAVAKAQRIIEQAELDGLELRTEAELEAYTLRLEGAFAKLAMREAAEVTDNRWAVAGNNVEKQMACAKFEATFIAKAARRQLGLFEPGL